MEFLKVNSNEFANILKNTSYDELRDLFTYIKPLLKNKENVTTRNGFEKIFIELFQDENFIKRLYAKLTTDKKSEELYYKLIWDYIYLNVDEVDIVLENAKTKRYTSRGFLHRLDGSLSLIDRVTDFNDNFDILTIGKGIKRLLKFAFPIPKDFHIEAIDKLKDTEFTYSNEENILEFISIISDMLKNNLVEFGKTGEKPLAKTLNILKASTPINEFYSAKKLDSFAIDMLTRSFSYFYSENKWSEDNELNSLQKFVITQLNDKFNFTISRIFVIHLKKIKFDYYVNAQKELFEIARDIIHQLPKDSWVSFENIEKYCFYRGYEFHFESSWKTENYELPSDGGYFEVGDNYELLFFNPILKAVFFYLGALGLVELKYNRPISKNPKITLKDKPYISVWDGLEYMKLTKLGEYVFGFSKNYTQKEIKQKESKLKFDEYKPIIKIDKSDSIMLAKLEPFVEKYEEDRYILSYSKIFRDCKNYKLLEAKIDKFYKHIETNPPKVFDDFFNDIKSKANMLKRDLKKVVIELKDNRELLNLFMTNKKLQELIIKAEGYRVIVNKDDITKLTKIVKDNGFFVDF